MIGQLQKLRDEVTKVIDRAEGCFGTRQNGGEVRQMLADGHKIVRVPQDEKEEVKAPKKMKMSKT